MLWSSEQKEVKQLVFKKKSLPRWKKLISQFTTLQLTNIIDDLFELALTKSVCVLRGVDHLIQAASCTQLHDNHLLLVGTL